MHEIITDHPDWQQFDREAEALDASRRAMADADAEIAARREQLAAEYEAAVDAALRRGEVPPGQPNLPRVPDRVRPANEIMRRKEDLRKRRQQWLADHAEELVTALLAFGREHVAEVAPAAEQIRSVHGRWASVVATIEQVERASGRQTARPADLQSFVQAALQ